MRIAVDCRNLTRPLSGISRSIANALEALSGAGIEIHMLAPSSVHDDFKSICELPNLHLRTGRTNSVFGRLLWGKYQLAQHVLEIRPDVFWAPAHRLSREVARLVPSVLTIHDLVWKHAPETMVLHRRIGDRVLTRRAVACATRISAVSAKTAGDLAAEFGVSEEELACIPNIVGPRPEPAPRSCLAELGVAPPYCLFVGTLEPRKNLPRTIEAFLGLPNSRRKEVKLVIAGMRGWLTEQLDKALSAADGSVVVLGRVDEPVLSRLYQDAAFVVMPSLYEGFGYPVVEAQQFGKRVLTSSDSSMAEIGGDTLVVVDPFSVASIAEGFSQCLVEDDPELQYRAIANAQRFEAEAILPQLLECFESARGVWHRR